MMEKYFCNYNQSVALKELGFNENCFATFCTNKEFDIQDFEQNYDTFPSHIIAAPLKSQVFEWCRKEYGLYHTIHHFQHNKGTSKEFLSEVSGQLIMLNDDVLEFSYHSTYDEAESACIDKLIEIIKTK